MAEHRWEKATRHPRRTTLTLRERCLDCRLTKVTQFRGYDDEPKVRYELRGGEVVDYADCGFYAKDAS